MPKSKQVLALETALAQCKSSLSAFQEQIIANNEEVEEFNKGWDLALMPSPKEPDENDSESLWNGYMAGSYSILKKKVEDLGKAVVNSVFSEEDKQKLLSRNETTTNQLNQLKSECEAIKSVLAARTEELIGIKKSSEELLSLVISANNQLSEVSQSETLLKAEVSALREALSRTQVFLDRGFRSSQHLKNTIRFLKASNFGAEELSRIIGESIPVAEAIWEVLGKE